MDVDTAGGENHVIGVARDRICSLLVGGETLFVEPAERAFVTRQRAVAAACPAPGLVCVDLDLHGGRAFAQETARLLGAERTAAERDHLRFARGQRFDCGLLLDLPERGLAPGFEDDGYRVAGPSLDLAVEVDERPAGPLRRLLADRRLAGSHEADERDVPA
jgi:hypothetical protein